MGAARAVHRREGLGRRRSRWPKVTPLVSGSTQRGTQDRPAAEPACHLLRRRRLLRAGEVVWKAGRRGRLGSRLGATTNRIRDPGLAFPPHLSGSGFSACAIEVTPALPAPRGACAEDREDNACGLLCKRPCAGHTRIRMAVPGWKEAEGRVGKRTWAVAEKGERESALL